MAKSQKLARIVLLSIFLVVLQSISIRFEAHAAPQQVKLQETEWERFGVFANKDARYSFGIYFTQAKDHWKSLANGTSVQKFETMIETYLVPHNIYWVTGAEYQHANTSFSKPLFDSVFDNFLTAADKYGIRVFMYTPILSSETPANTWQREVTLSWGSSFWEVHENGSVTSNFVRFDYIDKWVWQLKEDIKHLKVQYGRHPSFVGLWDNYEFSSFNHGGYITRGYSNQTLSNFTKTDFYKTDVNASGFHEDGTKCKLWEMFVDSPPTNQYSAIQLAGDVINYHNRMLDYKQWAFITILDGAGKYFRNGVNPEGFIALETGEGVPDIGLNLKAFDGIQWVIQGMWGDVGGEFKYQYRSSLYNRFEEAQRLGADTSMLATVGYWPGNNGGMTTMEEIRYFLLPYSMMGSNMPVIFMMSKPPDVFQPWSNYLDFAELWAAEIFNKMRFIGRHLGYENPLASILFVQGSLNEKASFATLDSYILASLGFNVTEVEFDEVKNLNLSTFDAIVWAAKDYPLDNYETTNKIIDAVNNSGTGLLLLGNAYTHNGTGGGDFPAGFDGKLRDLVKLNTVVAGRWDNPSSWLFNTTNNMFLRPYASLTANDFNHNDVLGRHWHVTKLPDYDGTDVVVDSNGMLIAMNRTAAGPGKGRIIWFGMYDTDNAFYSKATTVLLNMILWTAKREASIPTLWFPDTQGFQDQLYFSISGGKGQGLIWLSNNSTASQTITWNLNSSLFNLDAENGWLALDVSLWKVIAKGTGTNMSLTFTTPPSMWQPIYLLNQTADLNELYSNMFIESKSILADQATFIIQGPNGQTSWLVVNSTQTPTNVEVTNTGTLPQYTFLSTLNAATAKYGWYHDPTNSLLYVKSIINGATQVKITRVVEPPQPPPPLRAYRLSLYSSPISEVPLTVNGTNFVSPLSATLNEGTYVVAMQKSTTLNGTVYSFVKWEDKTTNPTREIDLTSDVTLAAYYEPLSPPPILPQADNQSPTNLLPPNQNETLGQPTGVIVGIPEFESVLIATSLGVITYLVIRSRSKHNKPVTNHHLH